MKTIWYKNYEGKWVKSDLNPTKKNLEYVRKHYALNGQCEIFIKLSGICVFINILHNID